MSVKATMIKYSGAENDCFLLATKDREPDLANEDV